MFKEKDMELIRRVYIDYKQLERKLSIDIGDTKDINEVYEYMNELKEVSPTNVELEYGYFDFNYKDMCLTISNGNRREVCRLCESIEIWNDSENTYFGTYDFEDIEKEVLGYGK